jgi:two-component system, OmpR family, sensor kinase
VRSLPLRLRVTGAFAAAMAALLILMAAVLHVWLRNELLDEIDTGLRLRAATIAANVSRLPDIATVDEHLAERREAFAQIVDARGVVTRGSPKAPVVDAAAALRDGTPRITTRSIPGFQGHTRVLTVPARTAHGDRYVVVVGASTSDEVDASRALLRIFAIGGPIALALAATAGWFAAGVALRPVERMRRRAAAVSSSDTTVRVDVPRTGDELERLAATLNAMLDRLAAAAARERELLDRASHELRTPVTALKAELDLALSRPRSPDELAAALRSASDEADRLAMLADDLLVVARARGGAVPVQRTETALVPMLAASARRFTARAREHGVDVVVAGPSELAGDVDEQRMAQAVDNLLDNAIRHARSRVTLTASADAPGDVTITVTDDGCGFDAHLARQAFQPFTHDPHSNGTGLGLAIVALIAAAHGGTARIVMPSTVEITLPRHTASR